MNTLKSGLLKPGTPEFDLRPLPGQLKRGMQLGWAIGREAGASLLTYELYPLGVISPSLPSVRVPFRKNKGGKKRPILFIHGIFHNRSAFAWLVQKLAWQGWKHYRELNLYTSVHSIPKLADQTRKGVEAMLKRYRVPQIDIVAHSMGGIIARYFIQKLQGDGLVRHLITLGTPHQGTWLSRYSVLPHIRELAPQSQTILDLNESPIPRLTQGLAISGSLDVFARPGGNGFWEGVRNVELKRVGHAGLLFSKRVGQIVASRLDS